MIKVIRITETVSTNILAKEYAVNGALHGTAIVAENQTAGRGRLGKKWQSIAGTGLYCSIIIRPRCPRADYHKMTLVAGLAVAEVIETLCDTPIALKWPNDLYLAGRKCAGILCEASYGINESNDFVVIGIGINVNTNAEQFSEAIRVSPTSLRAVTGKKLSIDELFLEIHQEVIGKVKVFEEHGLSEILPRWRERDMLVGKTTRCLTVDGCEIEGEALGVDDEGVLYLRDSDGELHEVLSGDVQAG